MEGASWRSGAEKASDFAGGCTGGERKTGEEEGKSRGRRTGGERFDAEERKTVGGEGRIVETRKMFRKGQKNVDQMEGAKIAFSGKICQ